MTRYAMVMDQRRCIGCSSCTIACRTWNELPIDIIYNPVVSNGAEGVWPHVHMTFTPLIWHALRQARLRARLPDRRVPPGR